MCGIVGIFSFGDRERSWPETVTKAMVNRVSHRGPDGEGQYAEPGLFLGHTRLAVLDTSPAGHQPMSSRDGRLVLVFNGEIYNFRTLKGVLEQLGHSFSSRSDTEVLLAAWSEWGVASLEKLEGIFAFALYDRKERELFLVRDHVGVKPLFYQIRGDTVFFSSELPALFSTINPVPPQKGEDLDCYFTFNYLPAPRTGLEGVLQLEAGCLLRVTATGGHLSRYWSPRYDNEVIPWGNKTVERFRELLAHSVRSQMVSDVPLGIFLSGGLDSYAVALSATAAGERPMAFTLGFAEPGFDERTAAAEYADYLKIPNRAVQFSWNEDVIGKTLGSMWELLADPSGFPLYQLAAFARQEVKVILSGDGADELLAGYGTYRAGTMTSALRLLPASLRGGLRELVQSLPAGEVRYGRRMIAERLLDAAAAGPRRDHASFRRIFGDREKRLLYGAELRETAAAIDPVGEYVSFMDQVPDSRSYLTACQHADLSFHLPAILAKVDRMSMAHGLEVRVPLLSRELLEFSLNLDDRSKLSLFGGGKRILRCAVADSIPRSGLRRTKAGFLPPVDSWFRQGAMTSVFGDHLLTARKSLRTLDWDGVEAYWREHRKGKLLGGFVLLGILQYINWSIKCRNL